MTCNGCKWLFKNNWCDMKRSSRHVTDEKCNKYDDTPRRFDPIFFYDMCNKFVKMYDSLKVRKFNSKTMCIDTVFNTSDVELLSFVLNDMKRELEYYTRWNLDDDLNKEFELSELK